MDGDLFHPGDEVEDIAANLALTETIPDAFPDTYPELGRIAAFVDRTRAAERISTFLELVEETVMLEHLLHGDGRFDSPEVDER